MNALTRAEIALIRVYQAFRFGKPSPCRFTPSCSVYGEEALRSHGVLRGNRLLVGRIVRCRPRGAWGADPVPQ